MPAAQVIVSEEMQCKAGLGLQIYVKQFLNIS